MFSDTQQAPTQNPAEGSGESEDSERQGDCREAIRLRKESRPDVISNGDLLKGLGPETKIEGHYKTLLQDRHSTLNDGLTHQFLMGTLWNGEV